MLIEKEVFDKYTKLIAAGIIQTSAKNFNGLNLSELSNLPINGVQIINLKSIEQVKTETYMDSGKVFPEFDKVNFHNITFETQLKQFLKATLATLESTSGVIDKKLTEFSYYMTFKNCHILKNKCILDSNNKIYIYKIKFGNTKTESIYNIKRLDIVQNFNAFLKYFYGLFKTAYITEINNGTFINYEIIKTLKLETYGILNSAEKDSPEINSIISEEWFSGLIDNIFLLVDFELGIIDYDSKNQFMFPENTTEIIYSIIPNITA